MIEEIEFDHLALYSAYRAEPHVKTSIDQQTHKISFNDAWNAVEGRFTTLRYLCGLACAFANTTLVEKKIRFKMGK